MIKSLNYLMYTRLTLSYHKNTAFFVILIVGIFGSLLTPILWYSLTYCRIGERSAYTWFVLKYLLGYPDVKNYEGSWAEWGSTVGNPIEK
jgi:hypothetical protein